MTRPTWARRHGLFAGASVLGAALLFAAYSNHFSNSFHFDDSHVIVNNLAIRSLARAPQFFTDATTLTSLPSNSTYRPFLTLSYALDYHLAGGLDPRQFHITQFLLLLLLGSLLIAFYRRLFELGQPSRGNRWAALFAAVLFCVHTANTETVNYISSRSSLVATLGVVASFLVFMAWPRGRRTLLYLLPMLIGGLAKPLAVMFAPLLTLYLFLFEQRAAFCELRGGEGWRKLGRAVRGSAAALIAAALLFAFLSAMDAESTTYSAHSRWQYLQTQSFVWLHYFRLFLLPLGLTADTDWGLVRHWYDTRVFAGGLFQLALLIAAYRLSSRARWRPAAFGLLWFAVALLPTSSIVPLGEIYNEHRIFFPYVGLTLTAVWVGRFSSRRLAGGVGRWRRAVGAATYGLVFVLLAAHALGTYQRNRVWKDEETLWRDVVEKSPENGRGLMNYGLTQMSKGENARALAIYERALRYAPNYALLYVNLGIVKSELEMDAAAEADFLHALELDPLSSTACFYYARWLLRQGRGPEAVERLETALELNPRDHLARQLLLRLYAALDDEAALAETARSALEVAPEDPWASAFAEGRIPFVARAETAEAYFELGLRKIDLGLWLDAAAVYRHALKLEAGSAVAWNNLGWARLKLGLLEQAAPCFRQALALDSTMQVARNNLAWIASRQGTAPSIPGEG